MHRYATAPRPTFEELVEEASEGGVMLEGAAYPACCDGRDGPVTLTVGPTGAIIVHVEPGTCRSDDFRLRLLFQTGTCIFSTPDELWRFWTGPLAVAFGIEPARQEENEDVADTVVAELDPPESRAVPDPFTPDDGSTPGTEVEDGTGPLPLRERPRLTAVALAAELAKVVHGQDAALERVASVTVAQLTKRHPARPGSVLLAGPSGVGKTSTVEALPVALGALGMKGASVFRLDCAELTDSIQVTRLLGAPPGYTGHASTTPLLAALEKPASILLVDEIEKAHSDVRDLLLGLLDAGRLTSPAGNVVDARHVVVALTTSAGSDELLRSIGRTTLHDRWAVQRLCSAHLLEQGLPADLVGRIGAFAVYGELSGAEAQRGIAHAAVRSLGREYGLAVAGIDPVVLDVVVDVAQQGNEAAGARGLHHAAQELLAERFAGIAGDAPRQRVVVEAGPPLAVRAVEGSGRRAGARATRASG